MRSASWWLRIGRAALGTWACLTVCLIPAAAAAQATPAAESATNAETSPRELSRHEPTRIYFGMWTTHLNREVVALDNNWVIGLSHRGFFGGTFLNSFGRRAFSGGLQRTIVSTEPRPIGATFGYRLGFVTGYDGRFMKIARKTPVLPLIQPFASLDVRHVGFEVSYTFVVASVAVSYRF
jgi:hypothetical protein